ncbi:metal ABC transporter substrate-binding protein [Sedimentibacter sp.]|uniref:metal ABC transporter substrate-binding protein n=1 Tax=Sedimentibacter sp. TaxID=1960295 RepID=UPI0028A74870|nr:metal ABC transporter substrate-binding protein [Sedimentibacter sp.]
MKKFYSIMLSIILILSLLAGCGTTTQKPSASAAGDNQTQDKKLSVYASFYPMYDFAAKIGGDKINAVNMVPDGAEPHHWEPTAADIVGLEEASVFIYNGAGMEHWVEDVLESIHNDSLIIVEASEGLSLLEGHHHEDEHDGDHDDEEHDDEGHSHGKFDPHVWLNPMNAKIEMENIKNAFIKADPENKDYYEANYTKYAAEFDALDEEFRDTLTPLLNKDIIVTHQAFGYLCSAYGLNQVPVEGLVPDSEPDPARIAEIIEFAKEHNVKVIFFEELVNPKVAEVIANNIGAKTDVLNPIEALSDEQRKNGDDYFAVMRQNLKSLKAALE